MTISTRLQRQSRHISHLRQIMALLQWDQEVMLPLRANESRAAQCALLSGLIHRQIVSPENQGLLREAEGRRQDLSAPEQGLLRVMQRQYEQHAKLPEKFVTAFALLCARALPVWAKARRDSNFSLFAPLLQDIVAISRQQADYLGFADQPYDALLDLHEEGLTTVAVQCLFDGLQDFLTRLIQANSSRPPSRKPDFTAEMAVADQIRFAEQLLSVIGYDFDRGRQDASAHPFTTSMGHHDRRVTNRYAPRSLEFVFSALHEGGHGLYEQGIAESLADTHLDDGISLGIHESQSRLWENIIGRSPEFWQFMYQDLCRAFPAQLRLLPQDDFVRHINQVTPGMIRVEADEVSYNLHILIRFELEQGLISNEIAVTDLPELWNRRYRDYLGVTVDSDANGVLQDIHWAHGSFGYFPTYTIGNVTAAQVWRTYCRVDPEYRQTVASGNLTAIRSWLTKVIYQHGAIYQPDILLQRITGEPLTSRYFKEYLTNKMDRLS